MIKNEENKHVMLICIQSIDLSLNYMTNNQILSQVVPQYNSSC